MSEFKSQIADLFKEQPQGQAAEQQPTAVDPTPQPVPTQQVNDGGNVDANPPIQPTEVMYGGVTETALLNALKERTGGKIQDFSVLEQLDEIQALRQKATELEAKAQVSPFANPIVEKLNQLYGAGADEKTVQLFLEAQTLNIDSLTERELYAEYLVRSVPNVTKAIAAEYFDEKFGDEDLTPTQKIEKGRELMQAKNYLKEQKMAAENPEAIRKQAEQREMSERNRAAWQQQVRAVSSEVKAINGKYNEAGTELSFGVTIQPQEVEQLLPFVLDAVSNMPLNADSVNTAKSILEGYWLMVNKDKFMQTVHRDGYAKGYELGLKSVAGAAPTPINETAPNAPQTEFDRFAASNPKLMERLSM